jgi:transposase
VTKTKRKRRIFTPEFKRQAVALFEASGRTVAAVAAEIDVHETVLRHWIDQLGSEAKGPGAGRAGAVVGPSLADQAAEIAQLRRENERLRMERDILKKAALILGDQKR